MQCDSEGLEMPAVSRHYRQAMGFRGSGDQGVGHSRLISAGDSARFKRARQDGDVSVDRKNAVDDFCF